MDRDPIKTDIRRRRTQKRLGCEQPICVLCGHPGIESLTSVSPDWLKKHGIEWHHVVGKKRDTGLVISLCFNCHRAATEGLARAGVTMLAETDPKTLVAQVLDALAVFFEMLVDALRRWAELLRTSISGSEGK